ncbi:MAG TPA: PDZ domain-containing protein, partial [Gemmatimonadales bacterium]|nr:PDZ domain-containing protein [Gemmatimonadales bacterium]
TRADKDKDKIGARVERVMSDGPADKAGLKPGDIITRFNGTALGGASAELDEESGPAQKLIQLAGKLEPGDTVRLEYRRGSETHQATVVAEDLSPELGMGRFFFRGNGEGPEWRGFTLPRVEVPRFDMGELPNRTFAFRFNGDAIGGMQLADLNPDLGDYFGSKEGVLVLSAPKDSSLALRAGDVILAIDGRAPKTVSQALRILRSYDQGETAHLQVLRHRQKLTVDWTVPDQNAGWKVGPTRRSGKLERT